MDKELRIWLISIVSILACALIVTIIILIKNHKFHKIFSVGKLDLSASVYVDPETNKKTVSFVVANKTINPISIISTGILYNHQKINLIEKVYQKRTKDNYTIATVDSRNSIVYTYDYMELFEYVSNLNRIKNIYIYAIDSIGVESITNVKQIKKVVKYDKKLRKKGLDININFESVLGKNREIKIQDEEESYPEYNNSSNDSNPPFELYRESSSEDEEVYDETNVDENIDDSNNIF